MSSELREGLELSRVQWADTNGREENFYACTGTVVDRITVRMQPGQMGMVPWAQVVDKDGKQIAFVNLSECQFAEVRNGV